MTLTVWDLLSMIAYFSIIFWPVVTGSDGDEMTRPESRFPHLLPVSSRTWPTGAVFHAVRLIIFILCGMSCFFSHLMFFHMLSNCVCILLKVNFETFYGVWGYSKFLFLSFHKFLGSQWHFASEVETSVLSFWVGLWVHTNHKCWESTLLSLWKKGDAAEYICKIVHVFLIQKVTQNYKAISVHVDCF
jgi:hypothetical protein